MKPLKPTMKENKRYLLIEGKDFLDAEKVILEFIGILGMAKAGLTWIKREKNRAIICINRDSINEVRASFAASPKEIKTSKVSGTLNGLKNDKKKNKIN